LIGFGLVLTSSFALYRRVRAHTLFTASGGLHLNVLLFFGLGGLAYTWSEGWVRQFDPYYETQDAMISAGLVLLAAYLTWILLETWINRSKNDPGGFKPPSIDRRSVLLIVFLGALAVIGRLGSDSEFAQSGVGTLLPVLRMFQYPIIALAISLTTRRRPHTFVITIIVMAISAYLAFISPWRSDIILLGGAVSLGLILRRRKLIFSAQFLVLLSLLFLLPFANEKKMHYDEVVADPLGTFGDTLEASPSERVDFVTDFWAVRINGLREAAFVTRGLQEGDISYRYGLTYWEAAQQLVPRALWPDKPSFNLTTNYFLAREIGLLSWGDDHTSWGVNFYAEAIWNLGLWGLFVFVPILFFLANRLDQFVRKSVRKEVLRWLVQGALFFMFIDTVGLVNMATYILWILLLSLIIERLLDSVPVLEKPRRGRLLVPGSARS
jgi:hypothetical protein